MGRVDKAKGPRRLEPTSCFSRCRLLRDSEQFRSFFGSRGQANYAAGCAFQSAICHLWRAIGQKGISLNVGLMRDIGVLAETGITEALCEWEVPYGIRGGDFPDLVRLVAAKDAARALADPRSVSPPMGAPFAAGASKPFYLDDAKFAIMATTGVEQLTVEGRGG